MPKLDHFQTLQRLQARLADLENGFEVEARDIKVLLTDAQNVKLELEEIAAESIGWIPLEDRAYLHVGSEECETIEVAGIPTAEMQGLTVLLVY